MGPAKQARRASSEPEAAAVPSSDEKLASEEEGETEAGDVAAGQSHARGTSESLSPTEGCKPVDKPGEPDEGTLPPVPVNPTWLCIAPRGLVVSGPHGAPCATYSPACCPLKSSGCVLGSQARTERMLATGRFSMHLPAVKTSAKLLQAMQ